MALTVSANPEVINEGERSQLTAAVMGGAGDYTYQWEPTETLDNPNICCPIATPTEPETTYHVTVTDADGNTISGEVTVSIRDWSLFEDGFQPHVYPNPNNGSFTIEVRDKVNYQLLDELGQVVLSGVCDDKAQVNAQNLRQGLYFLRILSDCGTQTVKLVIK